MSNILAVAWWGHLQASGWPAGHGMLAPRALGRFAAAEVLPDKSTCPTLRHDLHVKKCRRNTLKACYYSEGELNLQF